MSLEIYIRQVGAGVTPLRVDPDDTVGDLKLKIEDRLGPAPRNQRLVFRSKQLDDPSATLRVLEISRESTIVLVLSNSEETNPNPNPTPSAPPAPPPPSVYFVEKPPSLLWRIVNKVWQCGVWIAEFLESWFLVPLFRFLDWIIAWRLWSAVAACLRAVRNITVSAARCLREAVLAVCNVLRDPFAALGRAVRALCSWLVELVRGTGRLARRLLWDPLVACVRALRRFLWDPLVSCVRALCRLGGDFARWLWRPVAACGRALRWGSENLFHCMVMVPARALRNACREYLWRPVLHFAVRQLEMAVNGVGHTLKFLSDGLGWLWARATSVWQWLWPHVSAATRALWSCAKTAARWVWKPVNAAARLLWHPARWTWECVRGAARWTWGVMWPPVRAVCRLLWRPTRWVLSPLFWFWRWLFPRPGIPAAVRTAAGFMQFGLDVTPSSLVHSPSCGWLAAMRPNQYYSVVLWNRSWIPCDVALQVDGQDAGVYRLLPNSRSVLERPATVDAGRFTFVEHVADDGHLTVGDLLRTNTVCTNTNGVVSATFRPHAVEGPGHGHGHGHERARGRRMQKRAAFWGAAQTAEVRDCVGCDESQAPDGDDGVADGAARDPVTLELALGQTLFTGSSDQTFTTAGTVTTAVESAFATVRLVVDDGTVESCQ